VVRVSPGWVETEAAVGLVHELSRKNNVDYEAARERLAETLGGVPIAAGEAGGGGGPPRPRYLTRRSWEPSRQVVPASSRRCANDSPMTVTGLQPDRGRRRGKHER